MAVDADQHETLGALRPLERTGTAASTARPRRVLLSLPDASNSYMRATAEAAERAAARQRIALDVIFAEADFTVQVRQLCDAMRHDTPRSLLMVMPIEESSLRSVSEQALRQGLGWFWLHRTLGNEESLRKNYPGLPVSVITPDQAECGRIQARQVRALLPRGGRVLHVLGRMSNQSARLRTEGFDEILRDIPSIEVVARLDGDWSADAARQAVSRWLSMVGSRRRWPDAIVCQNDAMANGVAQGLRALEGELGEPSLSRLPVVGIDGLLSVGRALVDSGTLAATTVLPSTSDAALEAAALYIDTGELPPASIVLSPSAYPPPLVLRSSYPPPPSSRARPVPPSTRRTY